METQDTNSSERLAPTSLDSEMSGHEDIEVVARCALGQTNLESACFDWSLAPDGDDMTFRTHEEPVVHQEQTGTCWLQAGLTFLSALARKRGLKLRFSLVHMLHHDTLSKAELFLNSYKCESDERARWHLVHDGPVSDGGTWRMFVFLIETFGVVPHSVLPAMHQAQNTAAYKKYLNAYLAEAAPKVRDGTSSVETTMACVRASVRRVYPVGPAAVRLNSRVHGRDFEGTPQELLRLIRTSWPYDALCHAPDRPPGLYAGPRGNDPASSSLLPQDLFWCVQDADVLARAAARQLEAGVPVWFTCDVERDFCFKEGVAQHNLYKTHLVLGLPRSATKSARMAAHSTAPNHAMLLTAVKVVDGRPVQWRIQNSWGTKARDKGFVTAGHDWFLENVFHVAVDHCFLPPEIVASIQKNIAIRLQHWDIFCAVAGASRA